MSDTLSVLGGDKPVKVRLHGIDMPEKAQAFGARPVVCSRKDCGGVHFLFSLLAWRDLPAMTPWTWREQQRR
jgi:hypothetical protein